MRAKVRRIVAVGGLVLAMVAGILGVSDVTSRPEHAAAAVSPSPTAQQAGIATGGAILWENDFDFTRDMNAIADTGVKWIRFDVDWNSIQFEGPSTWRWDRATDRLVRAARDRGLSIVGMLAYSPPWARPSNCPNLPNNKMCLPADPNAFGTFARRAAERYGPNSPIAELRNTVRVWEIWNEPNHQPFAQPAPNPDLYTAMLKNAYLQIHAADPGATVLTGGTSPAPDSGVEIAPVTWLKDLYARGAHGFFDAVGHHPYAFPFNPLNGQWWNAFQQTQYLHDVMAANGDGNKKVWATEVGAPTGTDAGMSISEAQQAQWVQDYIQGWMVNFGAFTGPMMWFQHRDNGSNTGYYDDNFGLLRRDWSPKPAWLTFVDEMHRGTLIGSTTGPPGSVAQAFGRRSATNPNGGFYVLRGDGTVTAFGGAPYYGAPHFTWDIARGIAVMPDGKGYVVLDGYGGVHKFGSARQGAVGAGRAPYFGWDIARDVAIAPGATGFTVLDGWGGLNVVGKAPKYNMGYWPGWDIARAFAYTPSGGAYLLDGFGAVHPAGGAKYLGNPYWNWDIGRDLVVSPTGKGYAVLDGFGGVHAVGDSPKVTNNPGWTTIDRFKGIAQVGTGYALAR